MLSVTLPGGFATIFARKTAHVNRVVFHYVRGGEGSPILLLHGWPLTWYSWRKVMPTLAQRYDVIAIDLPGLGDSSAPSAGYTK